ncbi:ABC transporter permease [Sanguibacter sp. HDW7]|uniref:ABC transporter permease n=1 Tax=Sanguibacter sp. HDW7 TaxID=2714931 RepID=UPI001407D1CD|nr:ABC transporter permease [Sanguibacter sp. HDW7]QIK84211.1 ABC transporter permease [Sanguibacter sp. HDW7]
MSPVRTVRLVAAREIATRARSKAFVWTTAIVLVLIVGGSALVGVLGGKEPDPLTVGVPDDRTATALAAAATATGALVDPTVTTAPTQDGADPYVALDDDGTVRVTVGTEVPSGLTATLTVMAQRAALSTAIAGLGGDPAQVDAAVLGAQPVVTTLGEPTAGPELGASILGQVVGILIFVAIMTTGQMVAQGVVEEKSSRVIEILLAAIRPAELIAGKVLGIGALGLAQVVAYVGVGAASATAFGLFDGMKVDLGSAVWSTLVWFLLGYAIYALLFAAAGALVSRQEDVGSVTTPILMMLMVPYIVGISVAPWDPTNTLVTVLSYVPFFTPLIMPMRSALGVAAPWEVILMIVVCTALVAALVWGAGKIYGRAVLLTGARVPLREVLRSR